MIEFEHRHRVRYRECDPMGIVYHTHYLDYFEVARTEALRDMGLPYKELETSGVIMPVTEAAVRYHRPAYYDEIVTIRTLIAPTIPEIRLRIEYIAVVEKDARKVVSGHVTLCFFDSARQRPVRAPESVRDVFARAIERFEIESGAAR